LVVELGAGFEEPVIVAHKQAVSVAQIDYNVGFWEGFWVKNSRYTYCHQQHGYFVQDTEVGYNYCSDLSYFDGFDLSYFDVDWKLVVDSADFDLRYFGGFDLSYFDGFAGFGDFDFDDLNLHLDFEVGSEHD
jgi:hypothetical protein